MIFDFFNTKVLFSKSDPNTAIWISQVLDKAEIKEYVESLSYRANTIWDGVSLSQPTRTKLLILPTDIANLPDLEA